MPKTRKNPTVAADSSASAKKSPIGVAVEGSKGCTIGRQLGNGAQASVHAIVGPNGQESDWCVKVAPLPTAKSSLKKKRTAAERNADAIHGEHLAYSTKFSTLCGTLIPRVPGPGGLTPYVRDAQGFTYFVMERMEAPLWHLVDLIHDNRITRMGPFAAKLLEFVRTMHSMRVLILDVKADNMMIARSDSGASSGGTTPEELAGRLRLVDFGIIGSFHDEYGKHVANEGGALEGTPLYASLHVHDSNTPTRRDDVFAMGLVLAELLIRVQAAALGTKTKYESRGGGEPTYLPWAKETSDEALGASKEHHVMNRQSDFYKRMPDAAADLMYEYFQTSHGYGFKAKPDYEELCRLVSKLTIPVKRKQAQSGASTPRKKAARRQEEEDDRKPAAATRRSTCRRQDMPMDDDGDVVMDDPSDDEQASEEESEDEEVSDEELDDASRHSGPTKSNANDVGVRLVVSSEGKHHDKTFEMLQDDTNVVIVGSNPKVTNKGDSIWKLAGERKLDPSHARLELAVTQSGTPYVEVTDLKTENGTLAKGARVTRRAKSVYRGDTIVLGSSVTISVLISSCSDEAAASTAQRKAEDGDKKPASKRKATAVKKADKAVEKQSANQARISVVGGPHEGEEFLFDVGKAATKVTVGTKPTGGANGTCLRLPNDENVAKNHCRLDLAWIGKGKPNLAVTVTDLDTQTGTFIGNRRVSKNKSLTAHRGQNIRIGSSMLQIG